MQDRWFLPLLLLAVLFATVFALYFDVFLALIDWWARTTKYSHSLIIFPSIAYLIYLKRDQLRELTPKPEPLVLLLLFGVGLILPLSKAIDVQIISETFFVLLFPLSAWLVLGNRITGVIGLPLALLLTVVPAWESVSPLLASITADVANASLNLLGIPVLREGNYLSIPQGIFEIADGCGGFRYFIAAFSLALFYSYLYVNSNIRRLLIVFLAVALAMVGNWVRVMIVIWAGHITEMEHPFVEAHVKLGWWVFAFSIIPFYYLAAKIAMGETRVNADRIAVNGNRAELQAQWKNRSYAVLGFAALLLIVWPVMLETMLRSSADEISSTVKQQFLSSVPGWGGPTQPRGDWRPTYHGSTGEEMAVYTRAGAEVTVYIAYYTNQQQDKELVNFFNTLLSERWKLLDKRVDPFEFKGSKTLPTRRFDFASSVGERSLWSWYDVAGVETENEKIAKLLEIKNLLLRKRMSAVIAVLPDTSDEVSARKQAQQLLQDLRPMLREKMAQY